MKLILAMTFLFSFNLFADDFTIKFCTQDKTGSVNVVRVGDSFNEEWTVDEESQTFNYAIVEEGSIKSEDNLKFLSSQSGAEIIDAMAFKLENKEDSEDKTKSILGFTKDDIHLFEGSSADYAGSMNNCTK